VGSPNKGCHRFHPGRRGSRLRSNPAALFPSGMDRKHFAAGLRLHLVVLFYCLGRGPGLFNSNLSFAVLGQALASAWGKSYADLLKERVLRPLELNDTVISWREASAARLAPASVASGAGL